jgi:hypothetical protein
VHAPLGTADVRDVRRRVVLHLLARLERVAAHRPRWLVTDAVSSAEAGQCLVRQRLALRQQLLVDADEVALAAREQREDIVAVGLGLLGALYQRRCGGAVGEHRLDRVARDLEGTCDRA